MQAVEAAASPALKYANPCHIVLLLHALVRDLVRLARLEQLVKFHTTDVSPDPVIYGKTLDIKTINWQHFYFSNELGMYMYSITRQLEKLPLDIWLL